MRRAFVCSLTALALLACDPSLAVTTADDVEPDEVLDFALALKQGRVGADPSAFIAGDKLHVYSTSRDGLNVPHLVGTDVTDIGSLSGAREALPDGERGRGLSGGVWAPSVRRTDEGRFAMWYSGELAGGSTKKCLWRATASSPNGPFKSVGAGNPICPDKSWNIDPYLVRAPGGFWLYSKVGGNIERRRLENDGVTFANGSEWSHVLSPGAAWERGQGQDRPLVENPALVQLQKADGKKRWLLFYSGNAWRTRGYGVGYADCGDDVGPGACTKETTGQAWLNTSNSGGPRGPGAASFFSVGARDYMIIHGWANRCDDPKDTCTQRADKPCPRGGEDQDCVFENPQGRSMYLYRVNLGPGGNPIAHPL